MTPPNRRLRVLIGLAGALALVLVLVAPVALRGGGGSCSGTLRYADRAYTARPLGSARVVQALAIGGGVVSGCGGGPTDVDVRSVAGLPAAVAVALATETDTVYVVRGRCEGRSGSGLLDCLRR